MRQWGVCTKSKVKSGSIISSFFAITSIIYKNWLNYWNNFRNIRALQVAYHASFASIIRIKPSFPGVTPSSSLAYWWLLNFESTTLTPTKFSDMLRAMILLFSTDWKMAEMKTLIVIFVIMFPMVMMTQEDLNHGGNNQQLWHHWQNLIAHLRIVAILFQHRVSASCTEIRFNFSFSYFP